jgi:hypothetical protein
MPILPIRLAIAVLDSLYRTADRDETGRTSPNRVSECIPHGGKLTGATHDMKLR